VLVDASRCSTLNDVAREVGRELEALLESASVTVPHAVRVTITGASEAHGELFGLEAQLRSEVLAQIAAISHDRLWLEKVKVQTTPVDSGENLEGRADAIADLQGLLVEAESDPEFLKMLRERLITLVTQSPHELQEMVPALSHVRNDELSVLVREVRSGLVEHLVKAE
jgi:exonuclease SbcD